MDHFVFNIIASPPLFFAVSIGFIVLGTLAAILRVRAIGMDRRFRRVTYLWYLAGLAIAFVSCFFLLMFAPDAADGGWLGLMGILVAFGFAGVGAGHIHAAAGRCMDIDDTIDLIWVALIPFGSFYLMFKRGMKRPSEPVHSDLTGDVVKIALVALPFWAAAVFLDELPSRETVAARVAAVLIEHTNSDEEAAKFAASTMPASYFWSSFNGFCLQAAAQEKNEIRFVYSVPSRMKDHFDKAAVAHRLSERCDWDTLQRLRRKGVVTTLAFALPTGEMLATYQATHEDCGA